MRNLNEREIQIYNQGNPRKRTMKENESKKTIVPVYTATKRICKVKRGTVGEEMFRPDVSSHLFNRKKRKCTNISNDGNSSTK